MDKGESIIVKIKVKSSGKKKLPDWGLGPGILAEQEVILGEKVTKSNKIRFALKMNEVYDNLLEDTLERVIVKVKPKRKKK